MPRRALSFGAEVVGDPNDGQEAPLKVVWKPTAPPDKKRAEGCTGVLIRSPKPIIFQFSAALHTPKMAGV